MMPEIRKHSIFDSHAHYDDKKFDADRYGLLENMYRCGTVGGIINCGVDIESSRACINLSEKYSFCYAAAGFHAENLPDGGCEENLSLLEPLLMLPKTVAVGEIGLDYYWDNSNRERQKKFFEAQVILASRLHLPVIVHDRDAHADTLEILKRHTPRGVVHCFSGSTETALELMRLGMYIGIGGVITFKNAKKLREVAEAVPMERILLETDAPYLAPEPFRGKTCNSQMIAYTAAALAQIKDISVQKVIDIAARNTYMLFTKCNGDFSL